MFSDSRPDQPSYWPGDEGRDESYVAPPQVPGEDATASWGDAPRPRVELVKTSARFGQQLLGARYEVIGKPGTDRGELEGHAFLLLKRAMPDENPMEWTVSA